MLFVGEYVHLSGEVEAQRGQHAHLSDQVDPSAGGCFFSREVVFFSRGRGVAHLSDQVDPLGEFGAKCRHFRSECCYLLGNIIHLSDQVEAQRGTNITFGSPLLQRGPKVSGNE